MTDDDDRPIVPDQIAAAHYVADLSRELSRLARQHRLDALSYLLDMARVEAESVTGHSSEE